MVASYTPKASGGSQNLTTEYTCFSGVVLSLPAGNQFASICRISCSLFTNSSSYPSGIIISLSNSSSDYQASNKMIAKIETSDDKLVLTAEGIYFNPYDYEIPVYFWAKAKTTGQDRMYAVIEPLRTD